jgi:hypothetical protein
MAISKEQAMTYVFIKVTEKSRFSGEISIGVDEGSIERV